MKHEKKAIRVLVVDDSDFIRKIIVTLLSADREIEVVGEARNGLEALRKTRELRPDIVTMDIVMPAMDGMEAIERIMSSFAVPILVLTSKGDSHTAYSAISKGALEVLPKPEIDIHSAEKFISKIKLLSKVKVISHISGRRFQEASINESLQSGVTQNPTNEVIAVAASMGGPKALEIVLSDFPANLPYPLVVAQHIHDEFIPGLVKWLNGISQLRVKKAEEGEVIQKGTVYLSTSEKHMEIDNRGTVKFVERESNDIYFPSCNRLLSSVARAFGKYSIGVILSGMGSDGVQGIADIKKAGGLTIAQSKESSIMFGMPKEAIKSGFIDMVVHLDKIGQTIVDVSNTARAG